MNKKGFTLVELIGVVVILGLIAVLSFPSLLNQINSSKTQVSDSQKTLIISAAKTYVEDNKNDYDKLTSFEISVDDLVNKGYISKGIISSYSEGTMVVTVNNKEYDVVIK